MGVVDKDSGSKESQPGCQATVKFDTSYTALLWQKGWPGGVPRVAFHLWQASAQTARTHRHRTCGETALGSTPVSAVAGMSHGDNRHGFNDGGLAETHTPSSAARVATRTRGHDTRAGLTSVWRRQLWWFAR